MINVTDTVDKMGGEKSDSGDEEGGGKEESGYDRVDYLLEYFNKFEMIEDKLTRFVKWFGKWCNILTDYIDAELDK